MDSRLIGDHLSIVTVPSDLLCRRVRHAKYKKLGSIMPYTIAIMKEPWRSSDSGERYLALARSLAPWRSRKQLIVTQAQNWAVKRRPAVCTAVSDDEKLMVSNLVASIFEVFMLGLHHQYCNGTRTSASAPGTIPLS
jgi:hypothetical protein